MGGDNNKFVEGLKDKTKKEVVDIKKKVRAELVDERNKKSLSPTEYQLLGIKYKYEREEELLNVRIQLEDKRHKNVLEEIKKMKEAKITKLSR